MAKAKTAAEKAAIAEAKAAAKLAAASSAEKVSVLDGNGALIRQYSLKLHGEAFRDLANEFAGKEEGRVVEDAE